MTQYEHILDNRARKVVDYLRQHLSSAEVFRLVSAYFTIYGYEALQSELRGVRQRDECQRGNQLGNLKTLNG